MIQKKVWWATLAGVLLLASAQLWGAEVLVEGGPTDTGFNSGTFAYIHATVHGLTGQPKRYVVFAEIQYYGTTSNTSVEMDRLPKPSPAWRNSRWGGRFPRRRPPAFTPLPFTSKTELSTFPRSRRKCVASWCTRTGEDFARDSRQDHLHRRRADQM